MSQEHVYADYVTVRAGDLPVLAARTTDDLAQLDRPASQLDLDILRTTQHVSQRVDVLRRRHQLLSQFVEEVEAESNGRHPIHPLSHLGSLVDDLRRELSKLPLDVPTNEGGDLTPTGPGVRHVVESTSADAAFDDLLDASSVGESTTHAADRRVQLRVVVGWERDGQQVTLGVDGWDHDRAERVDLGGLHAALDWTAANLLLQKLRVGRDRSCGAPE